MSRRLTRLALALSLIALPAAAPLRAQAPTEPPRPKLAKGADPNDWRSYYFAGVKLIERSPKKAAEAFWWASRYNPGAADPLFGRWVALWRAEPGELHQYLEGAKFVMRAPKTLQRDSVLYDALTLDPFANQQLWRWLYEDEPGEWGGDAVTLGFLAYSEGRFPEALKQLGGALQDKNAAWWRLHYIRALSFNALQQFDSAAAQLEALGTRMRDEAGKRTYAMYDTPALYDFGVGTAYMRGGRLDAAREALGRALSEDLTLAAAHAALARVAVAQGNLDEALREYELALELRPQSGSFHTDYATTLLRARRPEDAAAAFEKAIAIEPHYAATYFNLAVTREQLGQKEEATRRYREFLERAAKAIYSEQIAWAETKVAGS